jgi:hypothetical protein
MNRRARHGLKGVPYERPAPLPGTPTVYVGDGL